MMTPICAATRPSGKAPALLPSGATPLQSALDVEKIQKELMAQIRHKLFEHIRRHGDSTFVIEAPEGSNTDVVVWRQAGDLILSLTLSPRVPSEQLMGSGSFRVIGEPYISVYGAPHDAERYLSGNKNGSAIALRQGRRLCSAGYDTVGEAVDYAMNTLNSDWPRQVRELKVTSC